MKVAPNVNDQIAFDLTVTQTSHTIQKGLQVNNKALAEALQAEKENMRQAKAVILQLQQQQHILLQHTLLLRRKLKEQEAKEACRATQVNPSTSCLYLAHLANASLCSVAS